MRGTWCFFPQGLCWRHLEPTPRARGHSFDIFPRFGVETHLGHAKVVHQELQPSRYVLGTCSCTYAPYDHLHMSCVDTLSSPVPSRVNL